MGGRLGARPSGAAGRTAPSRIPRARKTCDTRVTVCRVARCDHMRAALAAVLFLAAACGNSLVIDHSGDPGTPMPRAGASAAYDAANGTIVMFGGANRSGVLNETGTWDGAGWRLHHPKTSPPAREFAYMGFDPATGRVVLFGGLSCPPPAIDELIGCEYHAHSTPRADTSAWHAGDWSVL